MHSLSVCPVVRCFDDADKSPPSLCHYLSTLSLLSLLNPYQTHAHTCEQVVDETEMQGYQEKVEEWTRRQENKRHHFTISHPPPPPPPPPPPTTNTTTQQVGTKASNYIWTIY